MKSLMMSKRIAKRNLDCSATYRNQLKITSIIRRIVAKEFMTRIMTKIFYWVDEKEIKVIVLVGKNAEVQIKSRLMDDLATVT